MKKILAFMAMSLLFFSDIAFSQIRTHFSNDGSTVCFYEKLDNADGFFFSLTSDFFDKEDFAIFTDKSDIEVFGASVIYLDDKKAHRGGIEFGYSTYRRINGSKNYISNSFSLLGTMTTFINRYIFANKISDYEKGSISLDLAYEFRHDFNNQKKLHLSFPIVSIRQTIIESQSHLIGKPTTASFAFGLGQNWVNISPMVSVSYRNGELTKPYVGFKIRTYFPNKRPD